MSRGMSFFAGLAAGVAVALIYAPRSGKETQDIMRRKTRESLDQIASAAKSATAQIADAVAEGKDRIADAKSRLTVAVQAGKEAYEAQRAAGL